MSDDSFPGNELSNRELGVAAASVASRDAKGEGDESVERDGEELSVARANVFFSRRRAARGAPGVPSRVGAEGAEETIEGVPF